MSENRLAAARLAVEIPLAYARKNSNLATAALAGARRFHEMAHHPRQDVTDKTAQTRFYYHAHRHDGVEHGHFHLFHFAGTNQPFIHLVALSLDNRGWPRKWFTTNEWVTGEAWQPAPVVCSLLDGFNVTCKGRLAPVASWLTAMVHLYLPELKPLVALRDQNLARLQSAGATHSPGEARQNRHLDVLSELSVSLPNTIARLQEQTLSQP